MMVICVVMVGSSVPGNQNHRGHDVMVTLMKKQVMAMMIKFVNIIIIIIIIEVVVDIAVITSSSSSRSSSNNATFVIIRLTINML